MVKLIQQYDVHWISLDPTQGSEIAKTRPCVVISPNEMNEFLRTVIVAPITSTIKSYPWRIGCVVSGKNGSIATDQIRVIDKVRIGSRIGKLSKNEVSQLKDVLQQMLID
ncbi:MAG TPA: type II toxin-antitoxin system PemK/MazF family toxin [Dyadobacter sp.]|nr:type II toxin-antitoxin system PemK/MazF family toxin [Dyadobacter sp.]